jgi:hypothetical protein
MINEEETGQEHIDFVGGEIRKLERKLLLRAILFCPVRTAGCALYSVFRDLTLWLKKVEGA